MNYVDHINLFGVDVKQNPCIKGEGAPTKATIADVGFFYMDTLTGYTYRCISVSEDGTYTWIPNTSLYYNYIANLDVAFEDLLKQEGEPYTHSLRTADFSRTPIVGDIFFFIAKAENDDVAGVTAKVLGLQTDEEGVEWVHFSVEEATLFHNEKEIADLKETVDGLAIPLHYNYIANLDVAFEDLFKQGEHKDQPYSNSFSINAFSRRAKVGDIFSLIFVDKNNNNVYSFAEITSDMVQNIYGDWFYPFKIKYAILLHNTQEIAELKATVNGLKTEEWTFVVENEDGTTKSVTKKVYVQ